MTVRRHDGVVGKTARERALRTTTGEVKAGCFPAYPATQPPEARHEVSASIILSFDINHGYIILHLYPITKILTR